MLCPYLLISINELLISIISFNDINKYGLNVKTAAHTFALSRSSVIGLSFTLRIGMPMFSRLFALMNDQNRFGFVFRLSPIWLFT